MAMKLLCKSADERYPGAQVMKVDVEAYLKRRDARPDAASWDLGALAPPPVEPHERAELAAMSLAAGRKAKEQGAPSEAAGFFEAGLSALPDGSFKDDPELAFSLHAEAAECAYLGG
ncbi:hypothetical protein BE04_16430, partial [Sorangium cellulosum]